MNSDFPRPIGPSPSSEPVRNARKGRSASARPARSDEPRDKFQKSKTPSAEPKAPTVKVSYLPQDPGMLPPQTAEYPANELQAGPSNSRFRISESPSFPPARPNAEGHLVFDVEDPRFDATQAFVIADRSLKMAERYLGRELPWGFSEALGRDQLLIHPHVGADVANAFYSSQSGSLNFYHFTDPVTNEVVRTGQSADVVAHEMGHAILDAMRNEYISSMSIHGGGFHEASGDIIAMLTALQDDAVVEAVHAETQGDLSRPSAITRTAEGLGESIGHMSGVQKDALRHALNNFRYADQHFLPYAPPSRRGDDVLAQESHSYSNLFVGAFYDILTETHTAISGSERDFAKTLKMARDITGSLFFRAVELGPVGEPSYREMAESFLTADEVDFGGKFRPILEAVFLQRGILRPEDLAEFDQQRAGLPELRLTAPVEGKKAAESFLKANRKKLELPDRPYQFLDKRTNESGETILLYKFDQTFPIDGAEFGSLEGSKGQITGGLTLAFDKDGTLVSRCLDDITDREVEDILFHLKRAVGDGMLVAQGTGTGNLKNDDAQALLQSLHLAKVSTPNGYVLRRAPEIWG